MYVIGILCCIFILFVVLGIDYLKDFNYFCYYIVC